MHPVHPPENDPYGRKTDRAVLERLLSLDGDPKRRALEYLVCVLSRSLSSSRADADLFADVLSTWCRRARR